VYERFSELWQEPIDTVIDVAYRNFASLLSEPEEEDIS